MRMPVVPKVSLRFSASNSKSWVFSTAQMPLRPPGFFGTAGALQDCLPVHGASGCAHEVEIPPRTTGQSECQCLLQFRI